jgi:hypothetical protein
VLENKSRIGEIQEISPMPHQWFYGYGDARYGPFSGQQLRELADAGRIQPMDTVWQDDAENGVPAHRVKNLFPPGEDLPWEPPSSGEAPHPEPAEAEEEDVAGEAEEEAPPPPPKPTRTTQERKGRATALRGAIISSQDGTTVYFRKKCIKCGFEETGRNRMPIRNGVTRSTYFCPKCRKVRPVEIQGSC